MKAHIQIVGWNHYQYIGTCILSCQKQTVTVPIVYVDNNSTDGSVEYVRKNYPDVKIIENKKNRGYAGGHNDGIKTIPDSEAVICLNPDVILEADFVEKITREFEMSEKKNGAVVPLLFRKKERDKKGAMRIIVDAFGTVLKPGLNAVNLLEGEYWEAGLENLQQPWGFTGAAVAISREAIDALKDDHGNFFDEDFHSYREDVDVSWRMRNQGWQIVGDSDARAWHARVARKGEKKSVLVLRLSWRNYFFVIIKNASAKMLRQNWRSLTLQIAGRLTQIIITPALWGGLPAFFSLLPLFLKKRRKGL